MERLNSGVFFDRDGTLINHIPYLSNPKQVKVKKWVKPVINFLIENDFLLFLHTNQSGVRRGLFSKKDVIACNDEMIRQIGLGDFFIQKCIATELPSASLNYRKPSGKFGLEVESKYGLNLRSSYFIGDSLSDYYTAKNLNCNFIGIENHVEQQSAKLLNKVPNIKLHKSSDTLLEEFRIAHESNR